MGIDLGTSNSAACVYIDGKLAIVPSFEGTSINGKAFPSYVAFSEDDNLLIGESAKKQAVFNSQNTIKSIKHKMGSDFKVKIQDHEYFPQEISAFILEKIKHDTESFIGEGVSKAVITVPSYFNDNQRVATKDAARIAGFSFVKLLNETVAASLAYGIANENDNGNILIFDLGGGSLDISIIDNHQGKFKVLSTNGDSQISGRKMDLALKKYLNDEFKIEHGIDLTKDDQTDMRLEEAAEKAKIELSNHLETKVNLPFIAMDVEGNVLHLVKDIDRSTFDLLVNPIIKRCDDSIKKVLDDAVMKPEDIDRIILVGGATRIPIVQKYVEDYFGKKVESGINPMECVAQGAAIQAEVLSKKDKEIKIEDITPLSLGIENEDGNTSIIVKRNTPIPVKKSIVYTTVNDNQKEIQLNIVQGEHKMASDNVPLGLFIVEDIPPVPRGVPQVEITYIIDTNGILSVNAKEVSTGNTLNINIMSSNKMSQFEIDKSMQEFNRYFGEVDPIPWRKLLNEAYDIIYNAERLIKKQENKMSLSEEKNIESLISELKLAIENKDFLLLKINMYKLRKIIQKR